MVRSEGSLGGAGMLRHSWDDKEWWFQNYVHDSTRLRVKHSSPQVTRLGKCVESGARAAWNAPPPIVLNEWPPPHLGARQWHGTPAVCGHPSRRAVKAFLWPCRDYRSLYVNWNPDLAKGINRCLFGCALPPIDSCTSWRWNGGGPSRGRPPLDS